MDEDLADEFNDSSLEFEEDEVCESWLVGSEDELKEFFFSLGRKWGEDDGMHSFEVLSWSSADFKVRSLKTNEVDSNLEFLRWMNLNLCANLNEDSNDARGCKLAISDANLLPYIAG